MLCRYANVESKKKICIPSLMIAITLGCYNKTLGSYFKAITNFLKSMLRVDTRTNMKERSKQGVQLQYNAD